MRREHGQAAALTVLFLTVLLASAAAVIDVGSWFREDRDTQRVADAAALAGAQALPESQGTAQALAIEYGGKNGGGVAAANVSFSTTVLAGDTINVDVEKPADSFFAKIVGIDSVEVGFDGQGPRRCSRARRAGLRRSGSTRSTRFSTATRCCRASARATRPTLDLEKVGPGAFRLLNLDGSHGGTGSTILSKMDSRGLRRLDAARAVQLGPRRQVQLATNQGRDEPARRHGDALPRLSHDSRRRAPTSSTRSSAGSASSSTDFDAHGNSADTSPATSPA